jgi:hypothetical protein
MQGSLVRCRRWGMRHGLSLVLGVLVVGWGLSLWKPGPARADAKVDGLKAVALSDVALNLRLKALDDLKANGTTDATAALEDVAKSGDLRVASAACAALGRMKTAGSKSKLKGVLETSSLSTEVRLSAAACIAEHWKDSGDISYLSEKCTGTALSAHLKVLKSKVYKVEE